MKFYDRKRNILCQFLNMRLCKEPLLWYSIGYDNTLYRNNYCVKRLSMLGDTLFPTHPLQVLPVDWYFI